jgi:hypothetical protein
MKQFTVDQAGKVENTSVDTILALCSDEIQYSIKIPKKIKQEIFNKCKKRHKKNITFRLFAYGLYLLLKNKVNKNSIIIIDNEYHGHDKDIKVMLLKNLEVSKDQIRFDLVGKKDLSHKVANQTFNGKLKPNNIITEKQISLSKICPINKIKKVLK